MLAANVDIVNQLKRLQKQQRIFGDEDPSSVLVQRFQVGEGSWR